MVSAPQPEAVEAGLDVLRDGGNVVDAAVAAALVQTVVDPQMCGVAGFGSMHIYLAEPDRHVFIDFHGRAPRSTREDMWESLIVRECDDGFGFVLDGQVNEIGYTSMTTPLTIKALCEALELHGSRRLSDLIQPAIAYCEDGFTVRPRVHAFWHQPSQAGRIERVRVVRDHPAAARIYLKPDGALPGVGEVLRNPDMGRTYRRIASAGVDDFYHGEIARAIDADMRAHGGHITLDDLATCETEHTVPLRGRYRGFDVHTNQPPGGGLMVLEMLQILEHFDLAAMGHNSADYIATLAEAMKIATVDKDRRMGDPRFLDVPVAELLSPTHAASMAGRIRSGTITHVPRVNAGGPQSKETTHLCVADGRGNFVNVTHSLGSSSGVVSEGLGFMYNNCMMVFDPRPGNPGSLAPGKARFSAMCPTALFRDGKPYLILGAPGGTTITMGVLQTILNVVDFGMSPQEAVSAPRFCATSDTIELTNRILRSTERELQRRGYPTARYAVSYMVPLVHAVRLRDGKLDGGADPAGDGMAMAVTIDD
ncbi:MAG: gamma-glutamyltransferase family protein [Ectothiorhodospiraceae bacterium]|nr:gamma-glutamyltransferase family protein [Ectothiorhodospiraceae bacterium]